jgi:hypothetical protein
MSSNKVVALIAAVLVVIAGYSLIASRAVTVKSADLNNDAQVNVFDMSILLSKWGTNTATSDLNADGTVNIFDLSVLLSQWGGSGQQTGVCPAYPAFPDANCTGWQHTGVALKTVPSQISSGTGWNWEGAPFNYIKIIANNAVVDGVDVNGCVYVDSGVTVSTIKRSRISGNCDYMIRYSDPNASVNLSVVDTEIIGGAVQHKGVGFNWLRVNSHGFSGKAAMTGSGSTVEDSWVHDPVCNPPDHQSAIGTNGGSSNIAIRHNNIDLTPTSCTSGGIANYDDFGAFHNVLIEKNLINSGGYCVKAGFEDNNAAGNTGMQVKDNVFGRKYYPECGSFGIVSNWMPNVTGNVWSGNTWGGGAAATSAHQVGDVVNP